MDPATGLVFVALCGVIWYVLVYFEHIFGYSPAVNKFNQTLMYPLTAYLSFYKYTILYILLWIHAYQSKRRTLAFGLILIPFLDAAIARTYGSTMYPHEQFAFLRFRHFR